MSTAEQPDFVSVENYLANEEKATTKSEYIDGWVRAMSGPTIRHNSIALNCASTLKNLLKGKPCRPYNSDTKVRIRRGESIRFYYPDLQVVCDSNLPTDVFQDKPVVIFEVLSNSTRAYDLDEKMTAYLTIPALECYVILEQHIPFAIVMRRSANGFSRETYEGIEPSIDLPSIGCTLPMSEIYDGVKFTPDRVQEPDEAYDATV
jgi:Uma2 family endonuclease